jgi:hypothetical protein
MFSCSFLAWLAVEIVDRYKEIVVIAFVSKFILEYVNSFGSFSMTNLTIEVSNHNLWGLYSNLHLVDCLPLIFFEDSFLPCNRLHRMTLEYIVYVRILVSFLFLVFNGLSFVSDEVVPCHCLSLFLISFSLTISGYSFSFPLKNISTIGFPQDFELILSQPFFLQFHRLSHKLFVRLKPAKFYAPHISFIINSYTTSLHFGRTTPR